jgi:hypothetical protein
LEDTGRETAPFCDSANTPKINLQSENATSEISVYSLLYQSTSLAVYYIKNTQSMNESILKP